MRWAVASQQSRALTLPYVRWSTQRLASVNPAGVGTGRPILRSRAIGYTPLSTSHPAFGLKQAIVPLSRRPHRALSTEHPAFGSSRTFSNADAFSGPVSVSGFFFSVDPNLRFGSHDRMNPNAQLTVRDTSGNIARMRYRCYLEGDLGMKVEAVVRLQVGWVSPKVVFSHVPYIIHLGQGVDCSFPYLFNFTMVSLLDEHGDTTGSFLYLSGTPWLGFSAGLSRIKWGKLVLSPTKEVNPSEEGSDFIGHVHYRQMGFVVFKCICYLLCLLAFIPASQRLFDYLLPDPFHRHSEGNHK